eukprot:SAG11_NODE_522_length_8776_cov_6.087242_6_plen_170_part_00
MILTAIAFHQIRIDRRGRLLLWALSSAPTKLQAVAGRQARQPVSSSCRSLPEVLRCIAVLRLPLALAQCVCNALMTCWHMVLYALSDIENITRFTTSSKVQSCRDSRSSQYFYRFCIDDRCMLCSKMRLCSDLGRAARSSGWPCSVLLPPAGNVSVECIAFDRWNGDHE